MADSDGRYHLVVALFLQIVVFPGLFFVRCVPSDNQLPLPGSCWHTFYFIVLLFIIFGMKINRLLLFALLFLFD